jgi:Histidine kinase-, DNA gyrase B-, and HSP90-like ATPase
LKNYSHATQEERSIFLAVRYIYCNASNTEERNRELAKIPPFRNESAINVFQKFKNLYNSNPQNHLKLLIKHRDQQGCIDDRLRFMLYFSVGKMSEFLNTDYAFPTLLDEAMEYPLHEDHEVVDAFTTLQLAKIAIDATKNYTQKELGEFDWISEMVKNSFEAGATRLSIEVHQTANGSLVIKWIDDGRGMGPLELKALKIPGRSSKPVPEHEDINFGQGFWTARVFDEILVETSTNGIQCTQILFKNYHEDVTIQTHVKTGVFPVGTTLALKKNQVTDLRYLLLKIETQLIAKCQHWPHPIFFQNEPLCKKTTETSFSYEEPYIDNGIVKGQIHIRLGNSSQGIFHNDLKMSEIPAKFLSSLPEPIHKIMTEDNIQASIFLPRLKQVITRHYFVDEEKVFARLQKAYFIAALKYSLKKILEGKHWKVLSRDYWDEFTTLPHSPTLSFETLFDPDANNRKIKLTQQTLLNQAISYLTGKLDADKLQQFTAIMTNQMIKSSTEEEVSEKINQFKMNPTEFNQLFLRLPLDEKGLSLLDIRACVINRLMGKILANSLDFACPLPSDFREIIESCLNTVKIDLSISSDFDRIIQEFIHALKNRCRGLEHQTNELESRKSQKNKKTPLTLFIERMAQHCFNQKLQVIPYNKADGAVAYSNYNVNEIYVNLQEVSAFTQLAANYKKAKSFAKHEKEFIKVVRFWLETLAHEFAHIKLPSECNRNHGSHDLLFDQAVAMNGNKFLFKINQPINPITTLEEILNEN